MDMCRAGGDKVVVRVAGALLAALAAVGCTDDGDSNSPATESRPHGTATTTTIDSRSSAIMDDYQKFWSALLEASDPPDPDSAALAAHVTGEEKKRTALVLASRRRSGESVRGTYEHSVTVESVRGSDASINDCLTAHTRVYDANDVEKSRDPEQPHAIRVTLQLESGTWKVALITARPRGECEQTHP